MTRFKSLLVAAVAAATVAVVPAASAQATVHFVGAGSSAQFLMAAIATDQAACNASGQTLPCTPTGGTGTIKHWTLKSGGYISDNRDSLGRITNEVGNVAMTWIDDGSGNVTDLWFVISVDSTVGVRSVLAQETSGPGDQVTVTAASGTPGAGLVSPNNLWPDNSADSALEANAITAINGQHVNVGLTDIRPEDALFATVRAYSTLNTTTWAGLGYVGPVANKIGAPINSGQPTSTANATPIAFALKGKNDPFTAIPVPAYTTIPIGAAPIVFIANNNSSSSFPKNLVSGITPGVHASGQVYPLERLFAGVVPCDTDAAAFGGNDDGAGTPLTLFLREPLSGTMNTTEFSLFRTFGDDGPPATNAAYGTQENGVVNPTRAPYNPLNLSCPTHGSRSRAIGTGEVVGAAGKGGLVGTSNSLGYIFYGFANASKMTGSGFNYLTIDGVDPIGLGSAGQQLPNCTGTTCPASLWSGSLSYPNVRNGTYKAWSIYRWIVYNGNTDPYGPTLVAQAAQDDVDGDVADFIPFHTSTGSDGLEVYHSHFTQETFAGNNGAATTANSLDGGNTLGGTTEAGGDEGGLIEGPFGVTVPDTTGSVTVHTALTAHKGYQISWKSGEKFVAGTAWEGLTITIGGNNYTVAGPCTPACTPTATSLYITTEPGTVNLAVLPYSIAYPHTYPAAVAPGTLNKKQ
jgi:hypothetical protein